MITKNYVVLENYQALLWWIFQTGIFLGEMATQSWNMYNITRKGQTNQTT